MIDNQFTRNIDDDHGTGEGFEMGRKSSDGRYNSDLEENFDPLQESFFSLEKKNDQNERELNLSYSSFIVIALVLFTCVTYFVSV